MATSWTSDEFRLARASWRAAEIGGLNYFLAALSGIPDNATAVKLLEPAAGSLAELRLLADMAKPRITIDFGEDGES
jgi:hypothetical protein